MNKILLTGASGGIGSAIRQLFEEKGYQVLAPSREEMDFSDTTSIKKFFAAHCANNSISIFIHCAGFNKPLELENLTEEDIQKTFQINTLAFYTLSKLLAPELKTKGHASIIGISSLYGEFSRHKRLAYTSSKHALNGMVKTLALELGKYNIKVNAVSPGFVDTEMTRKNNSLEIIEGFKRKIPLGRLASTRDIAEVVFFLCSPQNNYINGQCLTVDGGYSIGGFQE